MKIFMLIMAILISGCVEFGHPINQAAVDQIMINQTTKQEIQDMMGKPQGVTIQQTPDGLTELWSYHHSTANMFDAEVTVLQIAFNEQGIVQGRTTITQHHKDGDS